MIKVPQMEYSRGYREGYKNATDKARQMIALPESKKPFKAVWNDVTHCWDVSILDEKASQNQRAKIANG